MHRHSEIATAYVLDTIATRKAPSVLVGIDLGFSESRAAVMYVGEGGTIYHYTEPAGSNRAAKRIARKAANRRKARRGWR